MRYRIVTFCGGGIRGLLSARILQRLAAIRPSVLSNTHLFAGTSTGSVIISWLLAGQSPEQIVNTFLTQEVPFFRLEHYGGLQPAYNIGKIVEAQVLLHGDKKLSEVQQHVLFTAFNVGQVDTPWRPLLFNNLSKATTAHTTVVDAVVSSGAMPGMFGPPTRRMRS